MAPQRRNNPFNYFQDMKVIFKDYIRPLQKTLFFNINFFRPVDHDLGDIRVIEQRLDGTITSDFIQNIPDKAGPGLSQKGLISSVRRLLSDDLRQPNRRFSGVRSVPPRVLRNRRNEIITQLCIIRNGCTSRSIHTRCSHFPFLLDESVISLSGKTQTISSR